MSFTGNEDHSISLDDASQLTKNYRDSQTTPIVLAEYFGRDAIESILAQDDCVGVRIYYGLDGLNIPKLVLVGVDGSENDMYNGILAEKGLTSPPHILSTNPLNT